MQDQRRTSFVACRPSFVAGVPIHLLARSIGTRKTPWQKEFGDPNLRMLAIAAVHADAQCRLVAAAHAVAQHRLTAAAAHTDAQRTSPAAMHSSSFFPPTYCS